MTFFKAFYFFILIELLVISFIDFKTRKISNNWSILNIILAPLGFIFFSNFYLFRIDHFIYPLSFFFLGYILFRLKIMGGGDAKLLATLFLIIPTTLHEESFHYLLISTIGVGSLLMFKNIILNHKQFLLFLMLKDKSFLKGIFGKKFPYAPVILLSWLGIGWKTFIK